MFRSLSLASLLAQSVGVTPLIVGAVSLTIVLGMAALAVRRRRWPLVGL